MPTVPLQLKPGVDTTKTPLLNEGGLSASQLVRFFNGLLQKLGGWTRLSNDTIEGICRGLHPWLDLDGNQYIAAGTNELLQLWWATDALIYDITPIASTENLANPFSTTVGDATVTVTDAAHGRAVGDWIYIATAAYVGGLYLQGLYQVATVPTANTFTFEAASNATSTVAAGGTTFSFTTTAASALVTVTLGAYTFTTGEEILVYVSTAVGGLTLAGEYTMVSATQFNAGSAAAGNATVSENGGQVRILYLLSAFPDPADPYGYGSGLYGRGPYGYGQGPTDSFYLRQWSLDNWGQVLIASPVNGAIYDWTPPITYSNRATIVTEAPDYNGTVFVAMPQQQLISLASDGGGFQDQLLVRWSDVSDYSSAGSWTASSTNQAGSFRIPSGSRIVGGFQGALIGYIWTDIEFWGMAYIQPPFIYSFKKLGTGCGLLAKRAVAELGGLVLWAGHKGIFMYDGQNVMPVPCAVWDFFFDNRDPAYDASITAGANSDFNEWALYFPTYGSAGENTSYIKYNIVSKVWDYGTLARTAWIDRSDVAPPTGTDLTTYLQAHETSNDADGTAMTAWAETAWIRVAEGGMYLSVDRLLTDFTLSDEGTVRLTVYFSNFARGADIRTYGPYEVTSATEYVIVRGRGRFMKIRVESNDIGTFWRQGQTLMVGAPSGRR